ncbi:MAG: TetR/AcrR family transcriptional regulator [Ramlibacter sp.]
MSDREPLHPTRRRIHAAALRLFAQSGATQLSISELAAAAGVARGTVYSHLADQPSLLEDVASHLIEEMSSRLELCFAGLEDPAMRLAVGVRHYVQRAHAEPDWGRFILRFGYTSGPLQRLWTGGPGVDLRHGMQTGRYAVRRGQARALLGMAVGGVLSAMGAVLEGEATWRAAGSDTAELLLAALGLGRKEAREIASAPLPPLPSVD